MLDYDDIVSTYKEITTKEGLEAAELYLSRTFDDTAIPEEVSKEIEVFLMREQAEASADTIETTVSDVQTDNTQQEEARQPETNEANEVGNVEG